jgi:KaiC/GvpD/RAD55 family RecA-like ATPase
MAEAQQKRVAKEIQGNLGDGKIPSGQRNDAMVSLAGTMQRRGMDPEAILAALLAENKVKCSPPLPEDEVVAVVTSVSRYEPDEEAAIKTVASKSKGLELDSVAELFSEPPPIDWLIEGRLARGDCALLVGAPASGKSWITMDLAISGALGLPILGHWPLAKPMKVMYIDEENPRDEVNRRMHAIFNATVQNGARPKALLDLEARLYPYKACQGFTFRDKDGYIESLTRHVSQIEPDLIILDSMTALSGIVDENKATEIRAFFHDKLYPLRRICNSAILCIHHSNKKAYETEGNESSTQDGQIRGSIDYLAAVDACLFATAVKNKTTGQVVKRMLKQTKQRRDSEPPAVEWDLVAPHDDGRQAVRPMVVEAKPEEASGTNFASFVSEVATKAGFETLSKSGLVKWAREHMKTPSPTPAMIVEFIEARTGRTDVTEGDVR